MPPLASLNEDSDYAGFLSEKVSESLRRAALRKLFHSSAFRVIDDLDDYAEDFTTFEALGDIVTADMRHQQEIEAQREAERLAEQEAADRQDVAEVDNEADEDEAPAEHQHDTETPSEIAASEAESPDSVNGDAEQPLSTRTSEDHVESTSHA